MMYQPRTYRNWVTDRDLVTFPVTVKETDLLISARSDLSTEAFEAILWLRASLESYISRHPIFGTSFEPVAVGHDAPLLVKDMAKAASQAGVGPMAAVAGAIAEHVGRKLLRFSEEVVVENGGDIFIKTLRKRLVGVYAGSSLLTQRIALEVKAEQTPCGVCASSGTVGHSFSFGKADAAIAIAPSASLADAAATAIGNRVKTPGDIAGAIEFARSLPGLSGVVIIKDGNMGLWGQVQLAELDDA